MTPPSVAVVCLAISAMALAQSPSNLSRSARPRLETDRGSYSFRGLLVAVGETGPAHEVVIRNSGDAPLVGVKAATHGDFAITSNRCPQWLPPAGSEQNWCAISVAFRPSAKGMRTGDLTVQAAGLQPQVVPLVAGTPINFPTLQPGASAVEWVELPAGTTAVSGTVDGPFAIALQASYDYGSINGISFGSTADTNGVCSPDAKPCVVYLGVEFLGTATPGSFTGTVTLSNGLSYSLSANVLGPGLLFSPSSIDGGSVPIGSTNDGSVFTITNVQSAAITLDQPSVTGPFSIKNGCGTSLAGSSSCSMTVFFSPTATSAASGQVQVPTGVGNVIVTLTGTGVDNPADVKISPATINFEVPSTGISPIRTVTITNQSAVNSVQIGAPAAVPPYIHLCANSSDTYCVAIVSNDCATLAPGVVCHIQLRAQGPPWGGSLQIPMTPSSATTASNYILSYISAPIPSSPPPGIPSLSPSVLQFPATPFGQVSAPLTVTVTNTSQTTAMIGASSFSDFVIDPSCGPLAPGQSCTLSVRYVPTQGVPQGSGPLLINAYDSNIAIVPPKLLGSSDLSVSGFSIPEASLASPSSPPLIQPLDLTTVSITNTSAAPLVLSSVQGMSWMDPGVNTCSQPIPPGGSCSVGVNFSPGGGYPHTKLDIYSNAQSSPDIYQFSYSATGAPSVGTFYPLATPVVFPLTAIGESTSGNLSVALVGGAQTLIDLKSNLGSDFTVDNQCPAILVTQPNHSVGDNVGVCYVNVAFTPQTPGFYTGTITLTSNFGLFTSLFAGTGAVSPLSVTPANLLFPGPIGQPVVKTVTVTNISAAAVSLPPAALTGFPFFSISQNTCGPNLAAGATCTIQITYSSPPIQTNPTPEFAQLVVSSGLYGLGHTVQLTGLVPKLVVTSNPSGFPPTSIGSQSDILFTLTSLEGAPITLNAFALNSANPADFKIASNTCTAGLVLQGTMSCVIDVAFAPHDLGPLAATLEIDNTAGVYKADLAGTGAPGPAQVSPTTLTFGNENLLVPSAPQFITLSNPNPAAVTLPALPAVSGANPADFSVTGNCATIPANGSCQLSVTFTPSAAGTRTASLAVGTGTAVDPNTGLPVNTSTTVNFAGVGVATGPGATVNPASLTFSPQTVGSTSAAQTVTLTNPGQAALSIASIAATDGFQQTNTCGSSLAPGSSCPISVSFAPTSAGPVSGTLTVTDNAVGTTQTVALSGTGTSVAMSAGSTALSISAPGGSARTSVSVSSVSGFSGTVSLKCAVTYQGSGTATYPPACTLSPGQVQISGASPATSTLTITTTGTTMALLPRRLECSGIAFIAALLLFLIPRRSKALSILLFSLVAFAAAIGCGSGSSPGRSTRNATTPGAYSVVVTATSSTLSVSTTISLTVQ